MSLPFEVKSDPFEKSIRGMYGRFATNESYQLNYLLTSLPIKQIDQLHTATEAFDISKIDFEQLIQRDIDYERVETIVQDYLEAGKNRVVFFPPLLVSLLSKQDGIILDKYSKVDAGRDATGKSFVQTWDEDKFQLILPISENSIDPSITHDGHTFNIYNFGANLRYNSSSVNLVVIDGQHRLTALKHLAESKDDKKRDVVKAVEIPICIVFSPNAVVSDTSAESITNNLRDLFVTINLKGKQVSGHFITLLDDNSLSAASARDLADLWKKQVNDYGYSRLHRMEWNQRELKLASTRQRVYSTTTVSIVGDCLNDHLFDDQLSTYNFLNIMPVGEELKALDDSIAPDDISERNFSPKHVEILKARIRLYITPALNTLLTAPSPYKSLEKRFDAACKWLDTQVEQNMHGSASFKSEVLQQYRETTKFDQPAVRTIGHEFYERCRAATDESSRTYFLNVFQQGLIRSWIALSISLNRFEVSPPQVAEALISSLDLICFNTEKAIFDFKRQYTQKTIYNGERLIINKKSKDIWLAIILCTFANDKVATKFVTSLTSQDLNLDKVDLEKIKRMIKECGLKNGAFTIEEYKLATFKDYEKHWREKDLTESKLAELTKLSEAGDEDSRKKFDLVIQQLADDRVEGAAEKLSNLLEIQKSELFIL